MTKTNNNKSVNKAMDNVRKAILEKDKKKTVKRRVKKSNIEFDDILLLTEVYKSNNINDNTKKIKVFKANIKDLIKQDIEEWLENNFPTIAQHYTKDSIKYLKNKKH
tara:strand:+ start:4892 stop:5212 length:321 start_codon:yes stop_codon:yes gene_type:complete